MGRPSAYWVFRISDGKTLAHLTFATNQKVNFVASPDGTLIAENSAKSTSQIAPAAPSTIIRRVSDMSVIATLDPSVAVLAFNRDSSLALVATTPWAPGIATHLDWGLWGGGARGGGRPGEGGGGGDGRRVPRRGRLRRARGPPTPEPMTPPEPGSAWPPPTAARFFDPRRAVLEITQQVIREA